MILSVTGSKCNVGKVTFVLVSTYLGLAKHWKTFYHHDSMTRHVGQVSCKHTCMIDGLELFDSRFFRSC